jgi:hypothetical protein
MIEGFKDLLGLLEIQGAIDATQINRQKPKFDALVAYYYSLYIYIYIYIIYFFRQLLIIGKCSLKAYS